MEKQQYKFALIFSIVVSLGFISFVSCIAAEFKRTKKKELELDGRLCYLPESYAFGFGIAALVCLVLAQMIGNSIICNNLYSKDKRNSLEAKTTTSMAAKIVLVISWISFGIAVIILSAATSMSRKQPYGKGWLDGECYLVKDGVYIGSAVLILFTLSSTLGSAALSMCNSRTDQPKSIDVQRKESA